jgi:hypothetical protein
MQRKQLFFYFCLIILMNSMCLEFFVCAKNYRSGQLRKYFELLGLTNQLTGAISVQQGHSEKRG